MGQVSHWHLVSLGKLKKGEKTLKPAKFRNQQPKAGMVCVEK
jgi:hypothetical protein